MVPMLEIILLVWAGRKLARIASERGRSGGWAGLGIGLWIVGELIGFVIGAMLGLDLGAYFIAILLAAGGLGIAFLIVSNLSSPYEVTGGAADLLEGTHDLSDASDRSNPYSPPRRT